MKRRAAPGHRVFGLTQAGAPGFCWVFSAFHHPLGSDEVLYRRMRGGTKWSGRKPDRVLSMGPDFRGAQRRSLGQRSRHLFVRPDVWIVVSTLPVHIHLDECRQFWRTIHGGRARRQSNDAAALHKHGIDNPERILGIVHCFNARLLAVRGREDIFAYCREGLTSPVPDAAFAHANRLVLVGIVSERPIHEAITFDKIALGNVIALARDEYLMPFLGFV